MKRARPLQSDIAARRQRRDDLAELVLKLVGERADDSRGWIADAEDVRSLLVAESQNALVRGGAAGVYAAAGEQLRRALPILVALGHDIEVVLRGATLLERIGVDLDQIFPPQQHEVGGSVSISVEQAGPARLVVASGPDCLVALPGHMALDVPLRLTALGQITDFSVNVGVAVRTAEPFFRRFELVAVRGAHICAPANAVDPVIARRVVDVVNAELSRLVHRPLNVGALPDMGLGQPDPYAAILGDVVRLHYALQRRPRVAVPPVAHLPDWADTAIKFAPDVVRGEITRRAREQQFSIESFSSPGPNVIDARGVREERFGRRIAKIDFSVRVTVRATIRTQARISPARSLELAYAAVDINVGVDITPDPLEWIADILLPGAREIARRIIEHNIPRISGTSVVPLPANNRAEVEAAADNFIVFLATQA